MKWWNQSFVGLKIKAEFYFVGHHVPVVILNISVNATTTSMNSKTIMIWKTEDSIHIFIHKLVLML